MMSLPPIAGLDADAVSHFVQSVLKEDLGLGGDVTTDLTIPADARLIATIQTREQIAVAGIDLAQVFFEALDPDVRVERLARDGDELQAGAPIMRVEGRARPMLSAERSALNTLQHLTGIATLTRSYANMIAGTSCILLDTRKTIPGLRAIEKYAARMGGAHNHRMRLDDGILIKDNHVAICGSIEAAVRAAKAGKSALPVQVEVDTIDQIEPALKAGADRLLFDNMSVEMLREGVALVAGRVPIEASGGVRLDTIRAIAETGVTYVSVGRITQSAPAADIGLDYTIAA
ncbi:MULTISPECIES: carboxylating nicotinate-nucleotide diphosphorylase [Sphingomonadales]|jgi:nicotinate-nucleotide pyrophosphorylase (carboxylating)|nr:MULTISPECIES: carboxylating nicotinate-nucleotide diphosphorylase [Sphingomonadales]MDI1295466.1 carboxylating nicotinate-nucleotide diphosphorylase [bacterium]TNE46308.1 MAG: carboxylating nicotinate-nucleotide diphosphorylase [Sphingomonadales bacterium]AOF95309.1 nicotinate-nucleotide diphosphorylase [Sphingobium sp. RAC03]ASY46669.1 nicotinate-nucleotide diphosphorylase (carboxylating) [Sphingobium xenophagum]MBD3762994.1 carboxylating nicotinate-nucleotide diphosphorylase [Rhizorhabdus|tara:strand:+ start:8198 stop:9064 length:867 start_codon:yes stop_codon:yes gene_type:complete